MFAAGSENPSCVSFPHNARIKSLQGETMVRASVLLLLLSCGMVLGCDTGSTAQNVSSTGWKGQKVGKSSNVAGPVPSSTTGTPGNIQEPQPKPPNEEPKATQNLDSD
jgi:hypothetical protein